MDIIVLKRRRSTCSLLCPIIVLRNVVQAWKEFGFVLGLLCCCSVLVLGGHRV
ncbi:hypothetical protein BDZ89DRAFT_454705 [Hymenopellis radicata]|nr:hypothetical protein BDZ89DRAFT_454705 [Hymenopellis radicata]